jgi:hypothetical protein
MACQLKATQNQKNHEVSDMDAWRCRVGAEIERDGLLERFTKLLLICCLRDKAAPFKVID